MLPQARTPRKTTGACAATDATGSTAALRFTTLRFMLCSGPLLTAAAGAHSTLACGAALLRCWSQPAHTYNIICCVLTGAAAGAHPLEDHWGLWRRAAVLLASICAAFDDLCFWSAVRQGPTLKKTTGACAAALLRCWHPSSCSFHSICCVLTGVAAGAHPLEDHWRLRRRAAALLASICAAFAAPHHNLAPRLCRVLAGAWLDPGKSLSSKYGAVVGLQVCNSFGLACVQRVC